MYEFDKAFPTLQVQKGLQSKPHSKYFANVKELSLSSSTSWEPVARFDKETEQEVKPTTLNQGAAKSF